MVFLDLPDEPNAYLLIYLHDDWLRGDGLVGYATLEARLIRYCHWRGRVNKVEFSLDRLEKMGIALIKDAISRQASLSGFAFRAYYKAHEPLPPTPPAFAEGDEFVKWYRFKKLPQLYY